jgi:hypothetical protein
MLEEMKQRINNESEIRRVKSILKQMNDENKINNYIYDETMKTLDKNLDYVKRNLKEFKDF